MAETQAQNGSVFISYSRKDKEFVHKLHDSLVAKDVKVWVDWEGIPLSADWMAEISSAVEGSDAFLVILSPDWLASKVCGEELQLGLDRNKKLIPVLYREPKKGTPMPEKVAATNWVYMREQDDFDATLPKLIDAINTDLGWVRQHTRILQRATEWNNQKRNPSFLLRGTDLDEGEKWMSESTQHPGRQVLPLQAEYIRTSRKEAIKRQRTLLVGVSLAMIISLFLAVVALFQWQAANANEKLANANAKLANNNAATAVANEHIAATQESIAQANEKLAKQNETIAKAQRNSAEAQLYQTKAGGLNTSTLLAVDSWNTLPSFQSEELIREGISLLPKPIAKMSQGDFISTIRFSPDGSRFATSSSAGSACVWDTKDGHQQYCVKHDAAVYDAVFTRDGKELITGGQDGSVRFWNAYDGTLIKQLDFGATIWGLSVSPNGKWLAIARDDDTMTAINLLEPKASEIDVKEPSPVYVLKFSPDSYWLAMGTKSGQVEIWYAGSMYNNAGPRHTDEVLALAFSPDSKLLLSAGADSSIRMAKTASGIEQNIFHQGDWVEDVTFSPDGSWFAGASDDDRIWIWDTKTGDTKMRLTQDGFVQKVKISPNGQWIASTGFDQTVRIWDANTGSQMMQATLDGIGSALAFTPDGNSLIVGDRKGNVSIWDISSLSSRIGYIEFPEFVHEVEVAPSGKWLVANTDSRDVWMLPTDQLLTTSSGTSGQAIIKADDLTYNMEISPDSNWVAVVERYTKAVLYNFKKQTVTSFDHGATLSDIGFSPDSQQLATAGQDGMVIVWGLQTGSRQFTLKNSSATYSVAFSADGSKLAVGLSGKIAIWDVEKQTQIATLTQQGNVTCLVFSQDGAWLASGSTNGIIDLWNAKDLLSTKPIYSMEQNGNVLKLAFSPDKPWLVSGGGDNYARIWDLTTGSEIGRIPHSDPVTGLTFTTDGKQLITASRKIVQIWNVAAIPLVPRANLVEIACSRLTTNLSETAWKALFPNETYHTICPDLPPG